MRRKRPSRFDPRSERKPDWTRRFPWLYRLCLYVWGYLEGQKQILKESLFRLRRTPWASSLTILVLGVALALPMGFHALVKNLREAAGGLETNQHISLFLKPELADEAGRKLAERLRKQPSIAEANLVTKGAGLEELRTYSDFGETLQALDFNPLPAVVSILPTDPLGSMEGLESLLGQLRALPETDFVQLDMEWLRKLQTMLAIVDRTIGMFGALLGLGVLFIVGNTIRLELQGRREEIEVAKLLGATDAFISRPFLYTGFWYGVLGWFLAFCLVDSLLLLLQGPARQLAELYGSPYRLSFPTLEETGALLAASLVLSVTSAFVVVTYHLRRMDV